MGRIIHGDAIEEMVKLYKDGQRFKTIVTSPPYNLRNSTGGQGGGKTSAWEASPLMAGGEGYDEHQDNLPREEYIKWQRAAVIIMLNLLTPDGALFYVHKERVQAGAIDEPALEILRDLLYPLRQRIIWVRAGGIPQGTRHFMSAHEYVYFIPAPRWEKRAKADGLSGENALTVWHINQEHGSRHPAPFPVELPKRCINSSYHGPVLDPFMGSGTTAVAAESMGIPWVGIESSEEYVRMAETRLQEVQPVLF